MAFKHQGAFEELLPQIRESGAGEGYDLVWFEHAPLFDFAAQVMQSFPQARLVCNTHNIEYRLEEGIRRLESPGDVAGWIGDQSRVIARKEYRAFRRADLTFVCSDADRKHGLDLCPSGNFRVAGNGVDTTVFKPSPGRRPPARPVILFTGTMKYPPNRDAVAYFIREIFPLITAKIPDCLFMVAGRDAEEVLAELNLKSESILVVSNPPDMRPLFEQAALCVVPLRAGGGTRLKIPEAMAMECAVVSTSIGAEGVPYEPGTHLLIADTEAGFAAAAVNLLSDLALRQTVAAAAAEFIRRNYAWHVIARTAMDDLRSLKEESRV